jgi:single-strand DNA-binding protein
MASLNKTMIIGHLGRDPEVSYTPGGMAVAKLSIATSDTWNDKTTGEKKERTEWHRVTFFGKQAETIGKYTTKGSQLYVEGRLQTSSYEKDGITRYSTDIIASSFQFLDKKGDNQQNQGYQQPQQQPQQNGYQQPQPQQNGYQQQPGYQQNMGGFQPSPDDSIPF